jgi:hypothetical protein
VEQGAEPMIPAGATAAKALQTAGLNWNLNRYIMRA